MTGIHGVYPYFSIHSITKVWRLVPCELGIYLSYGCGWMPSRVVRDGTLKTCVHYMTTWHLLWPLEDRVTSTTWDDKISSEVWAAPPGCPAVEFAHAPEVGTLLASLPKLTSFGFPGSTGVQGCPSQKATKIITPSPQCINKVSGSYSFRHMPMLVFVLCSECSVQTHPLNFVRVALVDLCKSLGQSLQVGLQVLLNKSAAAGKFPIWPSRGQNFTWTQRISMHLLPMSFAMLDLQKQIDRYYPDMAWYGYGMLDLGTSFTNTKIDCKWMFIDSSSPK